MPRPPQGAVIDRSSAWRQVEASVAARTPDSVFTSAAWLRACVETWSDRADWRLLELNAHDGRTAWALLGERTEIRHRMLPVRVLALSQAVDERLDQPWIEHNGFFGGESADFGEHLGLLLERLASERGWDELRLGGVTDSHAREAMLGAARAGLTVRLAIEQPSFQVDFDRVRGDHGGDYLAALSANTRQQLRRSRRLAEQQLGALAIDRAADVEQALAWFDATAPLHRARWGGPPGSDSASGFDNPAFVAFHRRLIALGFAEGMIDYLRVRAGETPLAYLYNFVAAGRVQFYLSGVDHTIDPSFRPGLLAHWCAIEHALAEGRRAYDFLAGDARYKRSLSTGGGRTMWLALERPRWPLQLERVGRLLKRMLASRAPSEAGPAHLD